MVSAVVVREGSTPARPLGPGAAQHCVPTLNSFTRSLPVSYQDIQERDGKGSSWKSAIRTLVPVLTKLIVIKTSGGQLMVETLGSCGCHCFVVHQGPHAGPAPLENILVD